MVNFSDSTLAIVFFIASILWYSWLFNRRKTASSSPGPRGLPIVGFLPFLKPDLHIQFDHLYKIYGPIFKLNIGKKLCFVISSPDLIKQIVRENDAVFANRDPPITALIATSGGVDILWSQNNVYWRQVRKLFVKDVLSNTNLNASYSLRRDEVRKTIRNLNSQVERPVEIGELIFATEFEAIMSLLWGQNFGLGKRKEIREEFRRKSSKLVDLLAKPNVSDFFPILERFDLQGMAKEMKEIVPQLEEIFDFVIQEKMNIREEAENNSNNKDVLDTLLSLIGQQIGDGSSFGLKQIKALLLDMLVASTDTTSAIVEWVMTELLNHPEVMNKVVEELIEVVGIEDVVEEFHTHKLHYLQATIKEAYRVHPVASLIPRSPSEPCVVGGYKIPAGTRVFMNVWSIHMDESLWENPSEFKPERFLDENTSKFDYMGNSFQYLPFGFGRRICPGLPLAERMVIYFIATLVHSFEWRVPKGEKIDQSEIFGLVMRKKVPLIAIPHRRFKSMKVYV